MIWKGLEEEIALGLEFISDRVWVCGNQGSRGGGIQTKLTSAALLTFCNIKVK